MWARYADAVAKGRLGDPEAGLASAIDGTPAADVAAMLTFWGQDIDQDLHDEVVFHIEARGRELIEQGWDAAGAREEVSRAFGDVADIALQVRRIDRGTERERRLTLYWPRSWTTSALPSGSSVIPGTGAASC